MERDRHEPIQQRQEADEHRCSASGRGERPVNDVTPALTFTHSNTSIHPPDWVVLPTINLDTGRVLVLARALKATTAAPGPN